MQQILNAITGFDVIKKGLTLVNTTDATNGVTSTIITTGVHPVMH